MLYVTFHDVRVLLKGFHFFFHSVSLFIIYTLRVIYYILCSYKMNPFATPFVFHDNNERYLITKRNFILICLPK